MERLKRAEEGSTGRKEEESREGERGQEKWRVVFGWWVGGWVVWCGVDAGERTPRLTVRTSEPRHFCPPATAVHLACRLMVYKRALTVGELCAKG